MEYLQNEEEPYQEGCILLNLATAAFDTTALRGHWKFCLASIRVLVLVEAGSLKRALSLSLLEVLAVLFAAKTTMLKEQSRGQ